LTYNRGVCAEAPAANARSERKPTTVLMITRVGRALMTDLLLDTKMATSTRGERSGG
jgi:hypothetical protein